MGRALSGLTTWPGGQRRGKATIAACQPEERPETVPVKAIYGDGVLKQGSRLPLEETRTAVATYGDCARLEVGVAAVIRRATLGRRA